MKRRGEEFSSSLKTAGISQSQGGGGLILFFGGYSPPHRPMKKGREYERELKNKNGRREW